MAFSICSTFAVCKNVICGESIEFMQLKLVSIVNADVCYIQLTIPKILCCLKDSYKP